MNFLNFPRKKQWLFLSMIFFVLSFSLIFQITSIISKSENIILFPKQNSLNLNKTAKITFTRTLSQGMVGTDVKDLQNFLINAGFLKIRYSTGIFGPLTKDAIIAYQKSKGIYSSGIVGIKTISQLKTESYIKKQNQKTKGGTSEKWREEHHHDTCKSFDYSSWSTCTDGIQTRTITHSEPDDCRNGNPVLSQSCCGNGTLDAGEQCEGNNLNGQLTCSGYNSETNTGNLSCNADCTYNTDDCELTTDSFQWSVPDRFSTIMVENQSATVQVILAGSYQFRIAYSTSEDMTNRSYSEASTVGGNDDVKRVTINNLTPGQKYYFKVQSKKTTQSSWINPLEGDVAQFRIPPPPGEPVTYMIISDGHFMGGNTRRDENGELIDENMVYKDGYALDYSGSAGVVYYLAENAIRTVNPDFFVFNGDETGGVPTLEEDPEDPGTSFEARYKELALAFASIGRPIYFAPGNHEGDLGETFYQTSLVYPTFWQGDLGRYNNGPGHGDGLPRTTRTKYLMSPNASSGGVDGRYGYLDYGDARLFFLTPFPYSTEPPTLTYNGESVLRPYDLGEAQTNWYASKISSEKYNMVFIHQIPYAPTSPQNEPDYPDNVDNNNFHDFVYGWGLPMREATAYLPEAVWADKGSNRDLFEPIENSNKNFLFIGHIHIYAHQQWENLNVYACPRPAYICWVWNPNTCSIAGTKEIESWEVAGSPYANYQGYYGAYYSTYNGENSYFNGAASLVVKINDNGNSVEVYGVNPDGDLETNIPDDHYSY